MKVLSIVLPVITLLAFATHTPASARKGKKPKNVFFHGIETYGDIINPGLTETEHGNILIRGIIQRAKDTTTDERVNGEITIEVNACLDPAASQGSLWGTFVLQNPGGKWLAALIGKKNIQKETIYAMGYGAGMYEGLLANWTYSRSASEPETQYHIQGFIVSTI
jgi:hypothetical protein